MIKASEVNQRRKALQKPTRETDSSHPSPSRHRPLSASSQGMQGEGVYSWMHSHSLWCAGAPAQNPNLSPFLRS